MREPRRGPDRGVTAREQQEMQFLGRRDDTPIVRGTGLGVILSSDGVIRTNNHVIDNALTINVKLKDDGSSPASCSGAIPRRTSPSSRSTGRYSRRRSSRTRTRAKVGERVVAIGSPLARYTVTTGVLSAKGRGGLSTNAIEDYLQTTRASTRETRAARSAI